MIPRVNAWAVEKFGVLIWLPPIVIVSGLVWFYGEILDIDRLSIYWGSMWVVPSLAFLWNAVDGWLDLRANTQAHVDAEQIKAAWWAFRQDIMLFLAALAMMLAGVVAIFQITPSGLITALLFFSGADVTALALWNRTDRWTVLQIRRRNQLRARESS